jgi:RimJ/RimL family protein N-acetyltransferase
VTKEDAVPRLRVPEPLSDGVVTLRLWRREDVPAIVAACNEPAIATFLDKVPQPYSEADAHAWLDVVERNWANGSFAGFAIEVDGRAIGSISAGFHEDDPRRAECGYWLAAPERGRGLTTRALRLLARWAFESCGLERLQLRADVNNVASQRVAEKAGFVREGVLRAYHYNPRVRRRVDYAMFSMLPGELENSSS